MHSLLEGVRVLDLTTVVLGPYSTQILGDLGADVIKIEAPGGDIFRTVRPGLNETMGAGFLNCNRNKRSISLDLRDDKGREAFYRLAGEVDVVIHNMRARSAKKLGIAYEDIRQRNPNIIYCYACGYGQDGPMADAPAYDDIIQAASGLAWINARQGEAPRYVPTIVADKVGGLHLAMAVLAALASRGIDGKGRCIEVPMFEGLVSFLMVEQLSGQSFRPDLGPTGYERLQSPSRKPFATRDGFVSIVPYDTSHWQAFFRLIGKPEMTGDRRVTDPVLRSQNIDGLYAMIEQVAPLHTTAEWLRLLAQHDIPCSAVNRLDDLLDHDHLRTVGMFREVGHPTEGPIISVRSPFVVSDDEEAPDLPAPNLGEHGVEVLLEFGFSAQEIDELTRSGVLGIASGAEA